MYPIHLLICYKFLSYRYKSLPELVTHVKTVQRQCRLLSKQNERLKQKIATAASKAEVILDEELHADLVAITNENSLEQPLPKPSALKRAVNLLRFFERSSWKVEFSGLVRLIRNFGAFFC